MATIVSVGSTTVESNSLGVVDVLNLRIQHFELVQAATGAGALKIITHASVAGSSGENRTRSLEGRGLEILDTVKGGDSREGIVR